MKSNYKINLYTALFIIFLIPYSIALSNEDGASANYSFILFPLIALFVESKLLKPKNNWLIFLLYFF